MASGKEYLHFILEQLSDLDDMPRPGGIRVGSSSSSSSGSSPPIISEHVISTSPISSGAMPCMSGRSYTLCVSATCRSSRIALGERPTACPSPLHASAFPCSAAAGCCPAGPGLPRGNTPRPAGWPASSPSCRGRRPSFSARSG